MAVITHIGTLVTPSSSGHPFSDVIAAIVKWFADAYNVFAEWIARPEVWTLLLVWFITFWVVLFIPLTLGFGPVGVIYGSVAAGLQSWMYGGFTPAGGVFAILTSIGMMGVFAPVPILSAVIVASAVTAIVHST